ncbi:MAG: CYTH domain-containing protein [Deltaproteobacteria bacterium]|nr:CYTH domain-containing protein [Deltaproteobacteria bacterium]
MALEIERKFLVSGDAWRKGAIGVRCRQGYLQTDPRRIVRVRVMGSDAFITVKAGLSSLSRLEFEYPMPVGDAETIINDLCREAVVEKTRYHVSYGGRIWEIDEFEGENRGLIVAEVELDDERQHVALPDWVGEEVSGDPRYYNFNLAIAPFTKWKKKV